ncbi:hypothetical protein EJB05_31640, partial [Eragrostis curvula]
MLAFDEEMRRQPRQKKQYKSIKLRGATHGNIEWSLKLVIQEILEANRNISSEGDRKDINGVTKNGLHRKLGLDRALKEWCPSRASMAWAATRWSVYWDGDFDVEPGLVNGDGDGWDHQHAGVRRRGSCTNQLRFMGLNMFFNMKPDLTLSGEPLGRTWCTPRACCFLVLSHSFKSRSSHQTNKDGTSTMAPFFMRFLPLLLLLLPTSLREYYLPAATTNRRPNDDAVGDELHPIVLFPGASCSELEARLTDAYRPSTPRCGAMKGKGWFGLWQNCSDLPAHNYVDCFMEQMSLVYDPATNEFRNRPGVETRVPNFGSTRFQRNPEHTDWCLENLKNELDRIGYRDGDTLFGAAYDLRHAPPIPGQPSPHGARRERDQQAAETEEGHPLRHSFGGMVALEFVRTKPPAWREKYIKHLVLVAPLPASGFMETLQYYISGSELLYVPTTTSLSLRPMWRTFESAMATFPSPAVFGDDRPLVITKRRNYTARDMADLLADVGAADAVEPFRRRELPKARYFEPPMVPVTCINGVGVNTTEQLAYWDGDFDAEPEVLYGDGDDAINLASMLALDEDMRRQPGQRKQYKSIKLHGATHGNVLTEQWSLKRVIQEILEANRLVYWDGDFDAEPEVLYGDGDDAINLVSMLAFDEEMRRQPGQRKQYKSIKLHGATHGNSLTEQWSLKRVIQEILEANRLPKQLLELVREEL